MVVTVMWMHSWTVVIISSCVLSVIGALLICCVCWETKKNSLRHFYILDEDGLKKAQPSEIGGNSIEAEDYQKGNGLFRRLSAGSFKPNLNFLSNNNFTSKIMSTNNERKKYGSRTDLTQSMEIAEGFDHCVLRLEGNDNIVSNSADTNPDKEDDIYSCVSNDSKHTFYSTYHMARTVSLADTIRSALSHSDLNNM